MNSNYSLIQNIDLNILININMYLQSPFMDKSMVFITKLGDSGLIWIAMALFLLLSKNYRKEGLMVLVALLLAMILGEGIIKNVVGRVRPFEYMDGITLLIPKPTSYSFPSGHTASSFAAAVVLAYNFKKSSYIFYILAGLIAFSRLYLFVHNPTDILGGVILGALCGISTIWIFKRVSSRNSNKYADE